MNKPFKKAGKLIRLARKKKGSKQAELAQTLGTIESHISKWETGQHKPSDTYLKKICAELGLEFERMKGVYVDLYYATQVDEESSVSSKAVEPQNNSNQSQDTLIILLRSTANILEHMKFGEEGRYDVYRSLSWELQSRLASFEESRCGGSKLES